MDLTLAKHLVAKAKAEAGKGQKRKIELLEREFQSSCIDTDKAIEEVFAEIIRAAEARKKELLLQNNDIRKKIQHIFNSDEKKNISTKIDESKTEEIQETSDFVFVPNPNLLSPLFENLDFSVETMPTQTKLINLDLQNSICSSIAKVGMLQNPVETCPEECDITGEGLRFASLDPKHPNSIFVSTRNFYSKLRKNGGDILTACLFSDKPKKYQKIITPKYQGENQYVFYYSIEPTQKFYPIFQIKIKINGVDLPEKKVVLEKKESSLLCEWKNVIPNDGTALKFNSRSTACPGKNGSLFITLANESIQLFNASGAWVRQIEGPKVQSVVFLFGMVWNPKSERLYILSQQGDEFVSPTFFISSYTAEGRLLVTKEIKKPASRDSLYCIAIEQEILVVGMTKTLLCLPLSDFETTTTTKITDFQEKMIDLSCFAKSKAIWSSLCVFGGDVFWIDEEQLVNRCKLSHLVPLFPDRDKDKDKDKDKDEKRKPEITVDTLCLPSGFVSPWKLFVQYFDNSNNFTLVVVDTPDEVVVLRGDRTRFEQRPSFISERTCFPGTPLNYNPKTSTLYVRGHDDRIGQCHLT